MHDLSRVDFEERILNAVFPFAMSYQQRIEHIQRPRMCTNARGTAHWSGCHTTTTRTGSLPISPLAVAATSSSLQQYPHARTAPTTNTVEQALYIPAPAVLGRCPVLRGRSAHTAGMTHSLQFNQSQAPGHSLEARCFSVAVARQLKLLGYKITNAFYGTYISRTSYRRVAR